MLFIYKLLLLTPILTVLGRNVQRQRGSIFDWIFCLLLPGFCIAYIIDAAVTMIAQ